MADVPVASPCRYRWLWLCTALVALARLWCLDADPPASMPDPTIMDEGLWADSARGAVLFPDGSSWFADDLGNSYLIAPLYTFLLWAVFSVLGPGLWQARLLAALASVATAMLAGSMVGRRSGTRAGVATILVLGVCPLLDQHGRFAVLESTQSFWLLASFALLFPVCRAPWKALLAGAAMGAAVLVKPNAVTFGVLPFAAAFGIDWWRRRRDGGPDVHRRALAEAAACVVGGLLVLLVVGLPVWLPHWSEFRATVLHESGQAHWTLSEHLWRLGLLGSREQEPGVHRTWALLRHAPLCTIGLWLLLARRATGRAVATSPWQVALWTWLVVGLCGVEFGYDHAARRQVLLLPAMAMLLVTGWYDRRRDATAVRPWSAYVAWLWLLLPLWTLAKPWLANRLAPALAGWFAAPGPGETLAPTPDALAGWLAGWLVVALLPLLPALPTWLGYPARPLVQRAWNLAPWLLLLAAATEVPRLGALPPHHWTVRTAQETLAPMVSAGEVVLGQHATTMFFGQPVRTVRRVLPGAHYSAPRPNPDVAERLRPRYVLDYRDPALQEFADVTADGFAQIGEVGFLREPAGDLRFELTLWERR